MTKKYWSDSNFVFSTIFREFKQAHINSVHLEQVVGSWPRCSVCLDEYFETQSDLDSHMKQIHGKQSETSLPLKYQCLKCEETNFKSLDNLKAHYVIEHMDSVKDSWVQCPVCENMFNSDNALDSHLTNNHSNLRYACDFCVELLKSREESIKHMLNDHDIHTEQEPCRLRLVDNVSKSVIGELTLGTRIFNALYVGHSKEHDLTQNQSKVEVQDDFIEEIPVSKRIKLEPVQEEDNSETIFASVLDGPSNGVKAEPQDSIFDQGEDEKVVVFKCDQFLTDSGDECDFMTLDENMLKKHVKENHKSKANVVVTDVLEEGVTVTQEKPEIQLDLLDSENSNQSSVAPDPEKAKDPDYVPEVTELESADDNDSIVSINSKEEIETNNKGRSSFTNLIIRFYHNQNLKFQMLPNLSCVTFAPKCFMEML